jgi:hypothetical protein
LRIILRSIFRKWDVKVWTWSNWLKIGTKSGTIMYHFCFLNVFLWIIYTIYVIQAKKKLNLKVSTLCPKKGLNVSGFLLAHLQRQMYKFGSGSSLLGMVSARGRWHHTQEIWTTVKIVHLPLKMG